MADVRLSIASREYIVTCRDGEEAHLQSLAATVDDMVQEAGGTAGGLNESRQLLFAALLLADKLHELQSHKTTADHQTAAADDIEIAQAAATIEKLADRLEALAVKLEN
jgi:cell division protein ZapA